jgi:hypothetical protein
VIRLLTHPVLTVWQPEGLGGSRVVANYTTSAAMWLWCVDDRSVWFCDVCVFVFLFKFKRGRDPFLSLGGTSCKRLLQALLLTVSVGNRLNRQSMLRV